MEQPKKAGQPRSKGAGGRKTKLTPELVKKVRELKKNGATNEQLAAALGIAPCTVYEYQKKNPEFAEAIKGGQQFANQMIVGRLYRRAFGYPTVQRRVKKVRDEKTKKLVIVEEVIIHGEMPSDPTSMALWLNNLMPEQFQRRPEDGQGRLAEINFNMTVINADGKESSIAWPDFLKRKVPALPHKK